MAGEPKDETTVELPDDDVVTVDVSDLPVEDTPAAAAGGEEGAEAAAPVPRKHLVEEKEPLSAADEAAARVAESLKKAEDERKLREAAEATAKAERRAREAAEAEAARLAQERQSAQTESEQHQLTIIKSGIDNTQRQIETAEAELTRAYEAGEFALAAKTQTKLGKLAADLSRLEEAQANFDAAAAVRKTAPVREARPAAPEASVFEQWVSQLAPASQAWLRAHPECAPPQLGGDAQANARMMAGHWDAVGKGITVNTPEYFATIEQHTGHKVAPAAPETKEGAMSVAAHTRTVPAQRKPPVAAPPSRDPPSATTGLSPTTREVRLTKEQQEAAKISFPHLEPRAAFAAYARNLVQLEAEGKMGRTTH